MSYVKPASREPKRHSKPPRSLRFGTLAIAIVFYSVSLMISEGDVTGAQKLVGPAIVLAALSIFCFFYSGLRFITASSLLSYGILLFLAFPAVYAGVGLSSPGILNAKSSQLIVISLAFVLQCLVLVFTRQPSPPKTAVQTGQTKLSSAWLILAGFCFALALLCLGLGFSVGAMGMGWLSVLFCAVVAFDLYLGKIRIIGIVALLAAMFGYATIIFSGFGRLVLAVIGISIAVVGSVALRTWWVKFASILVTVPALLYLTSLRLEYLRVELGRSALDSEGIGSVIGPFNSAATIVSVYSQGELHPAMGSTLLTALLVWVPREIWPGKGNGFGLEIVPVTQPGLAGVEGFTDAATIVGEGVWNFGIVGAAILLVLVAFMARAIDFSILGHTQSIATTQDVLNLLISAVSAASLMNLVWGGSDTATGRALFPLAVLLLAKLVAKGRRGAGAAEGRHSRSQSLYTAPQLSTGLNLR